MKKRSETLRNEADKNYLWHLDDIFANEEMFWQEYELLNKKITNFSIYKGNVSKDIPKVLKDYFDISLGVAKVFAYSKMMLDGDTTNTGAQSRYGKAYSLYVNFMAETSFLKPELLLLDENKIKALAEDEKLADYASFINNLLHVKPHTLTLLEERLLAMMGDSLATAENTFSMLTDADMQFPDVTDVDGGKTKLTESYYSRLIQCNNREVRKEAFNALFKTYDSFKNTIASTYSGNVKNDKLIAELRHFNSSVEASLHEDRLPLSVYDNLVSVVNSSIPYLNEYLHLRKEILAYDNLELYDLYVPMMKEVELNIPYDQAFEKVLNGLEILGKDYTDILKKAYKEGWIDVYENKSKASGAYSYGVYGIHPFILLNHNDDLNSCMTLAHELGHTMHSWYSNNAQSYAQSDYSLFVAEVASTVNEVLLIRYLLKNTEDKNLKAYLLNYFLEQFRTTVFRQTMFAEFERISHAMAESGDVLTHEALSEKYLELNKKYYGDVCNIDKLIEVEWMRIPHFYRSFYVFVYATGFSAAVFLANRILKEGEPSVRDYKKFLSAGGSVPPLEALRYAGVDMEKPDAIIEAMHVFKNSIIELKEILS